MEAKIIDTTGLFENLSKLIQSSTEESIIAGYYPISTEINVFTFLKENHSSRICLPVVTGKQNPLEFRLWSKDCKM